MRSFLVSGAAAVALFPFHPALAQDDIDQRPGDDFHGEIVVTAPGLERLDLLAGTSVVSGIELTSAALTLPAIVALQFVFILSLAYPLAVVHVWFRDTQYLLRVALQLFFYLTPIFYQTSSIPDRFRTLYQMNPMVLLVEAYRDVLLRGKTVDGGPLLIVGAVSAGLLIAGVALFKHTSHRFGEQL